jgi:catechol 2,3-dioxygenase-like lactoylglutathione lyase family enzyme
MATVRYFVGDVDRAVRFYVDQLGFELETQMGSAIAMVRAVDGLLLWLSGPQSSAARPMQDGRQPEPGGWNRIVVEVSDLEQRVESLLAAGVTFRNPIVNGPGGKQVLVEDTEGNVIELFEAR